MRGQPTISPIYRLGERHDPDPLGTYARVDHLRRKAWREQQTIICKPGDLPDGLRQAMVRWVEGQHGA